MRPRCRQWHEIGGERLGWPVLVLLVLPAGQGGALRSLVKWLERQSKKNGAKQYPTPKTRRTGGVACWQQRNGRLDGLTMIAVERAAEWGPVANWCWFSGD